MNEINSFVDESFNELDARKKKEAEGLIIRLRNIILEREFLSIIIALKKDHPELGNKELETLLFLITKPPHKVFGSLTDIYDYIYNAHLQDDQALFLKKDRKEFFGSNAIFKRLQRASLLIKHPIRNNKKKTWKKHEFIVGWRRLIMQDWQGRELFIQWDESEISTGLEGFIYNGRPEFPLSKNELKKIEGMTMEELHESTNNLLFWLGLYTIESTYKLFNSDKSRDKEEKESLVKAMKNGKMIMEERKQ